jgi:hypothetical protein
MLVALTSEAHGSDDICQASALRDKGGMPVDEAVLGLAPVVVRHVGGPNEIAQAVGGGPFRCGVIEPCSLRHHAFVCSTATLARGWPASTVGISTSWRPLTDVTPTSCQRRALENTSGHCVRVAVAGRGFPAQDDGPYDDIAPAEVARLPVGARVVPSATLKWRVLLCGVSRCRKG